MYQLLGHVLILLTMAVSGAEEVALSKGEHAQSRCTAKFNCIILGGSCVTNAALCKGRLAAGWCKGKACWCCIPENQCVLEDSANSVLWHKIDMSKTAITDVMDMKIDYLEKKIEDLEKHLIEKLDFLINKTTPLTPAPPTLPGVTTESPPTTDDGVTSGPRPTGTDDVNFTFVNRCTQDLWMGADGRSESKPTFIYNGLKFHTPNNGGWHLPAGATSKVSVPFDWLGARFWARTGCTGTVGANFHCETGDCGPWIECATGNVPRGGAPPVTIAEMTLNGNVGNNMDFFDISLVDGFNVPMTIHPVTYDESQPNPNEYWCTTPKCLFDINSICPSILAVTGASGTVACNSACMKFNTPEYCCRPPCCGLPSTCTADKWPVNYPKEVFKDHCPQAYSFAYDDETSTFTCRNTHYVITFC